MKIWLDDIFPPSVSSVLPESEDWIWVKNYNEFVEAIIKNEQDITLISFDNDLGEELEGKHCFNEMESMLYDDTLQNLKRVILHSDNSGAVASLMTAKNSLKRYFDISLERHRRTTSSVSPDENIKNAKLKTLKP